MITSLELEQMKRAALNYTLKHKPIVRAVPNHDIVSEQAKRRAEERSLAERAAKHRMANGEWPLELEALPVLEYQRIRRLALIYASKNGIVFPKKRRTVDEKARIEKARAYHKKYQAANKEKIKARRRAHYLAHRQQLIEWQLEYKKRKASNEQAT